VHSSAWKGNVNVYVRWAAVNTGSSPASPATSGLVHNCTSGGCSAHVKHALSSDSFDEGLDHRTFDK
jgi:hypothetical protein